MSSGPRIGVNGFGRIGRLVVRAAFEKGVRSVLSCFALSSVAKIFATHVFHKQNKEFSTFFLFFFFKKKNVFLPSSFQVSVVAINEPFMKVCFHGVVWFSFSHFFDHFLLFFLFLFFFFLLL